MKLYSVPPVIRGIIFDIDNTLYRNDGYADSQTRVQVERLAWLRGLSTADMERELEQVTRRMTADNAGRKPSLGNTFREGFGIPVLQSVAWREELLRPEDYLEPDPRLIETFEKLSGKFKIAAVTNNPGSIGRRTLAVLGIEQYFAEVTGLEVTELSKPALEPFIITSNALGIPFSELVNVGDRWNVDLELPLKAGLGGILVESMEDVYALPETLCD